MDEVEEFENNAFEINIVVALGVGLGICVFGDVEVIDYFTIGGVLLFFSMLAGLVRGVFPPSPLWTTVLSSFNFGWFYYWSYARDELLISLIFPTGLMVMLFVLGGIIYRKEIMEKHKRDDQD